MATSRSILPFFLLFQTICAAKDEYKSDMGGAIACRGDCGTRDTTEKYTGVVRLCVVEKNQDPREKVCEGSTATMIEKDIVASEAHVIGFSKEESVWTACCDSAGDHSATVCSYGTDSQSNDMRGKEVYIADGEDTTSIAKTKIIGKVTKFGVRSTGLPPGYDIFVGYVDRNCQYCLSSAQQPTIKPIPLANSYPKQNADATWVFTAGTGDTDPENSKWRGRSYAYRQYSPQKLGKAIGSPFNSGENCRRQPVPMNNRDGNPLAVADTSGSPVIIKSCDSDALHGFHGNGESGWCTDGEIMENGKEYLCEVLQLVQSQKKWIGKKIKQWTGRTVMLDACSASGTRSIDDDTFDVEQYGCRTDSSMIKGDGGDPGSVNVCKAKGYTGESSASSSLTVSFSAIVLVIIIAFFF